MSPMKDIFFSKEIKIFNYGKHQLDFSNKISLKSLEGELNICSKCISSFPTKSSLNNHMKACVIPFSVIYKESAFRICKIQVLKTKQLLSLISQGFIKSKTLYYEVENYDFFVVCTDEIVGYFSRYKNGPNSLSCLLVFPCFQGEGWGTILFDFSNIPAIKNETYFEDQNIKNQLISEDQIRQNTIKNQSISANKNQLISENQISQNTIKNQSISANKNQLISENQISQNTIKNQSISEDQILLNPKSPEKPYSKKAIFCFRKYWKYKVVGGNTINEISKRTNLTVNDVILGLEQNGFDFKKWKLTNEIEIKKPRLLSKRVIKRK